MSTRPFLEDIEKKWLAFQLLCALRDCHARDVFHGDIKTENTMVTSWNWLYLSDFSSSFKPTTLPEDNPADFSYYFDTAGRRTCYLAPERFLAAGEAPDGKAKVTWAMDVFSAGCVIAELFLETPIFNLSQLYKYRKGEYDPQITYLERINDKDVRELIRHMINVDPEKRYSAEEYLNFWRGKVFPEYFYSFLHQYLGLITDQSSGRSPGSGASANPGEADDRIDRVYHDFDKISYFLGYETQKAVPSNRRQHQSGIGMFPVHLNIPNNEHEASMIGRRPADDGTLIFLTLIVSSLRNTARSTARVRACDLLLAFAERLTDEAKLDRVLPYVVSLLNDKSDIVKVAALRTMTQLMALVSVISPVNAHIFPEYLLPRLQSFICGPKDNPSALVRATYASCLGSLATTASRFLDMVATLRADGSLPTEDPEAEDGDAGAVTYHGLFDNARAELIDLFEGYTKALITDSDSSVKRAFLGSVPDLCMFFGTAESNDIILSHLNTYLNDRDWMLKCAFFETIVGVATFLGGASLEDFILPLMVQALTDPEEFVVEKVLRSLASMAELGLFQRTKTWELVDVVGRFTMHPNIWIREAAAMFLSSSTIFLSSADSQCIILPLIRPYMKILPSDFAELTLLDALKKPLPRAVFDLAVAWAVKVDRGVFWKPVHQSKMFSFGSANQTIPAMSSKDPGHNALAKVPKNDEDEQWLAKLRNMGMSSDDEFKLLALREYIWRMAPSKARDSSNNSQDYLTGVIHLGGLGIIPQTVWFSDTVPLDEPLRDIEPLQDQADKPHTIADALLDASMTIDDSISRRRRSAIKSQKARVSHQNLASTIPINGVSARRRASLSPSPASSRSPQDHSQFLSNSQLRRTTAPPSLTVTGANSNGASDDDNSSIAEGKASVKSRSSSVEMRHKSSAMSLLHRKDTIKSVPETGTTSTNAFGKVERPFAHDEALDSALALAEARVQKDSSPTDFRFRAAHSYAGNDPSILKLLDSMYLDNFPSDIVEFGPLVTTMSKHKAINRSSAQATDKPWRPEGVLVSTFAEHVGTISRVLVAPDHMFFITGGEDGTVRIWDSFRLERNIMHRSRQIHKHAPGARISSLCFIESTHCFVSAATDGSIHVVKVDCTIINNTASRFGKLRQLRDYQLPADEFAVWSEHFKSDTNSILLLSTNKSRVLALELRTMTVLYSFVNPVHHGTPTCFITDKKHTWLLLGTAHGVLSLWDLRFRLRLKSWGLPGATAIHRLTLHPFRGRGKWVCVAGGTAAGEVTVWDLEKTQCREIYRAGGGASIPQKNYEPWPVDEDRPEGMLGRFATALEQSGSGNVDRGVWGMAVGTDYLEEKPDAKYGFLITGGSDRKVRFWDMVRPENSLVVNGLEAEEPKPSFGTTQPSATLVVNAERVPRREPTAPNAGAGTGTAGRGDGQSTGGSGQGKHSRSTVISLQQQYLLRAHLDAVMDVAVLERPYGMVISVDREGVIYVFQ